tara:strand:+ start:895 stop:1233 length:339 start_codon:yes stop_codon:yes gene_type:complete
MIRIAILVGIIYCLFTFKVNADEWSKKNIGQGVGGFLGVLSTQLMKVDNPYMLATGGLLGMIVGGEVGEHMERTDDLHEIETARCKKFVTGNNKKGLACRENGQWVVVKLEN